MKRIHAYLFAVLTALLPCAHGRDLAQEKWTPSPFFGQPTDVHTVFRAQSGSGGVPLPADAGSSYGSGIIPDSTTAGGASASTPFTGQPPLTSFGEQTYPDSTWNAFSPPISSDPFATGPAGGQPYAPYTPYGASATPYGGSSAPLPFSTFGANGPAPFRQGWHNRLDLEYLPGTRATGAAGHLDQFGVDYGLGYSGAYIPGWILTWTNQFRLRTWDGPDSGPGLPGKAFRFGWDFQLESTQAGPISLKLGVTPSINSDLEQSIGSAAFQLDGRGMFIFQLNEYWSMVLGAAYWDRVSDRVIPYGGVVYRDDFWEARLMYPESTISLFLGNEPNWAKWAYFRAEHHIEAYDVSTANGGSDQVELEDWRAAFGFRMDGGMYSWFIEAGYVFNRDVDYGSSANGQFSPGDGFITRMGWRY